MAATDTTSTTLSWFLLYISLHPGVQEKLFEEIESKIGNSRLPSLRDRPLCHYAEAVIHETLRYSSMVSMGGIRRVTDDVQDFHGYFIPKDTLMISNLWGAHFNPELWDEPQKFNPSRFLDSTGKFKKSDNLLAFSAGRRNCLGEGIARDQLFLYVTALIQRFKVSYPEGEKPQVVPVPSLVLIPAPFRLIFQDRFGAK